MVVRHVEENIKYKFIVNQIRDTHARAVIVAFPGPKLLSFKILDKSKVKSKRHMEIIRIDYNLTARPGCLVN